MIFDFRFPIFIFDFDFDIFVFSMCFRDFDLIFVFSFFRVSEVSDSDSDRFFGFQIECFRDFDLIFVFSFFSCFGGFRFRFRSFFRFSDRVKFFEKSKKL